MAVRITQCGPGAQRCCARTRNAYDVVRFWIGLG